ncbi:P-type conjugative transfer protein TrbJ [uncultured Thiodictyon sp.]|uniref:P-type conjugative transfer protein TrbJ n=1 Tax=uncultured Thiodictyon sp. TaxID=1846217 RepID=UPI0025D19BD5|nr:P-type conjugative transfer protein TrbJ [uncultured Thiodictyon sp.]
MKHAIRRQTLLALATVGLALTLPARAGVPTVDGLANTFHGLNLVQNTTTAMETVAQTLQQVQQYATQLQQLEEQYRAYATQVQQYENMVKNTLAPAAYIWNDAQAVMTKLRGVTDTLAYYKNQTGSIDAYLAKFQDANYYRNSPCYTATGCSAEEMARLNDNAALGSQAQKKANDAAIKGLDQQQDTIQTDAARLQRLQANAQTAAGQMEAIGYASQLAAEQGNQLIQIRGLLAAQQNAVVTQMQATTDLAARQDAGSAALRSSNGDINPTRHTYMIEVEPKK